MTTPAMKFPRVLRLALLACVATLPSCFLPLAANAQSVAEDMTRAADALLDLLDAKQRERMEYAFTDREREDWHYVPRSRAADPWQD